MAQLSIKTTSELTAHTERIGCCEDNAKNLWSDLKKVQKQNRALVEQNRALVEAGKNMLLRIDKLEKILLSGSQSSSAETKKDE